MDLVRKAERIKRLVCGLELLPRAELEWIIVEHGNRLLGEEMRIRQMVLESMTMCMFLGQTKELYLESVRVGKVEMSATMNTFVVMVDVYCFRLVSIYHNCVETWVKKQLE